MEGDPEWVGTTRAAELLGITNRTLYRLIDSGRLSAYQLGRVIRLQRSDIDAFVEASRIRAGELRHLLPDRAVGKYDAEEDQDGIAQEPPR